MCIKSSMEIICSAEFLESSVCYLKVKKYKNATDKCFPFNVLISYKITV